MVGSYGIPIQRQEVYGYRKDPIPTQLWKISMEEKPNCIDGTIKARRFSYGIIKKLGINNKINENSKRSYEIAVWQ